MTLSLTADQYVRLVANRLPLERALAQGVLTVEGDRARLLGLNRIFRGIGGGSYACTVACFLVRTCTSTAVTAPQPSQR